MSTLNCGNASYLCGASAKTSDGTWLDNSQHVKKKILFMVQLPPPVHGAALRNRDLAESKLLRENFSIRVLPLRFVDSLNEIGGFSIRKLWRFVVIYFNFLATIILRRPDIAYFTITPAGSAFKRDAIFAATLKFFRIDTMYHLRGLGVKEGSSKNKSSEKIYRFVFHGTTVICLGKEQVKDVEHLPVKKFMVVPDGIAPEIDNVQPVQNGNKERLTILYLSNFVTTKGVFDFLDALQLANADGLKFNAIMAGDAADVTADQLRRRAEELGLAANVSIRPPVYGSDKFDLYLASDIFFFPTFFELFPGVVLEAMQCSRAILTTRTGCIPEMVDDGITGLLFSPRSIKEMAEKLKLLSRDAELREKLGVKARLKYLNEFTFERYEKAMKQVFDAA